MNIDEGKLQDVLSRRKIHIKSYCTVFEALIALLSYAVSILLSGILNAGLKVQIHITTLSIRFLTMEMISAKNLHSK